MPTESRSGHLPRSAGVRDCLALYQFLLAPAVAQELPEIALATTEVGAGEIAAEATKVLPAQDADRGDLMPLHVASVLGWLCGDGTVQTKLGTTRSGCYQQLWPVTSQCTAELQTRMPLPQNRVAGEHLDVVSFRKALRECFARRYGEAKQALGRTAPDIATGDPDPLATRMGR